MTYLEIDKALFEITRQKRDDCQAKVNAVPKENATERKALQIEHGMYSFCCAAGFLAGYERDKAILTRKRVLNRMLKKYPKLNELYQKLDEDEKLRMIAAVQAELFIRDQWLLAQRAELAAAEVSGDAKSVFEFSIKIGAVESMFGAWETWRKEHGVYPHLFKEDEA